MLFLEWKPLPDSPPTVDFQAMAKAQPDITEIQDLQTADNTLNIAGVSIPGCSYQLLSDASTGTPRPFVPENFQRTVFNSLHNLAHPGITL